MQTYLPIIDLESATSISDLFHNLKLDNNIDPNGYFQRFSLSMSLTLNYGIRLDGTVSAHQLLNEVVTVERELANFRGIAHNWQDYVPILRLWPGFKKKAIKFRGRRDDYILSFFQQLKERIANATDNPCIAGNVLKDPEAKLSENELKSICLTMVAAGLDTLPGNINMTIAYLSSQHGQEIQKKLHEELVKAHAGEDPWHACLVEEKSEYMRSFVKEVLRFWSTLNLSFNRESTKPIMYKGAEIPTGTPFVLVSFAHAHCSNNSLTLFKRTCGQPTTIPSTLVVPWISTPSASWVSMRPALAHSTTAMALVQGCAQVRTWLIASYTPSSAASCSRFTSSPLTTLSHDLFWTRLSAILCLRAWSRSRSPSRSSSYRVVRNSLRCGLPKASRRQSICRRRVSKWMLDSIVAF